MKSKFLIPTILVMGGVCDSGYAITCNSQPVYGSDYSGAGGCPIPNNNTDQPASNCASYQFLCHTDANGEQQMVIQCKTCPSGYNLVLEQYTSGYCDSVPYWTCVQATATNPGTSGSTCNTSTCTNSTWTNFGVGYQIQIIRTCGNTTTTCKDVARIYRCASGYYGISSGGSSSMSGCSKCPDDGISVPGSNETKTQCFIAQGTDETGTFNFGGNRCFYSE